MALHGIPVRLVTLLLLVSSALTVRPIGAATLDGPGSDHVQVTRVHWPVLVETRRGKAAGCRELDPEAIEVREDGDPRPVTALGARPQPRIHALLIDTSRSMQSRLDKATEAAASYLAALPADDLALVATFDDNLVLRIPPTLDRGVLNEGLARLRVGNLTALWDAVYYTVRYLEPAGSEKIVVLISDGEDSVSLEQHSFQQVLELVRSVPDLTVFTVGLDLKATGSGGFSWARHQLGLLADQTGGDFYEPRRASQMTGVFEKVRRRLEERLYLSYIPAPFGEGPRDGANGRGQRWREVTIRSRDAACRITAMGMPRRLVRDRLQRATLQVVPGGDSCAARLEEPSSWPCGAGAPAARIAKTIRLGGEDPTERTIEQPSCICSLEGQRSMVGRAVDLLLERAPLFTAKSARKPRPTKMTLDREPVFRERGFVLRAPPIDELIRELRGPEDVLEYLLEHESCAPDSRREDHARSATLIHGQTYLELRELIGRALYSTRPDYAAWAMDRTATAVDVELPGMLRAIPDGSTISAVHRQALRDSIVERESDARLGGAYGWLVEWLGDVPAGEAALVLERRVINDLLRDPTGEQVRAERIAASWFKLDRWFGPATRVRILTPLVPAFDRDRQTIGFYRFLLPSPEPYRSAAEPIPDRPLALLALASLMEDRPIRDLLVAEGVQVRTLRYSPVRRRELSRSGCSWVTAPRQSVAKVAVELTAGEPESFALGFKAFFDALGPLEGTSGPARPLCLAIGAHHGETAGILATALAGVGGGAGDR
jgi:hypothetical protein